MVRGTCQRPSGVAPQLSIWEAGGCNCICTPQGVTLKVFIPLTVEMSSFCVLILVCDDRRLLIHTQHRLIPGSIFVKLDQTSAFRPLCFIFYKSALYKMALQFDRQIDTSCNHAMLPVVILIFVKAFMTLFHVSASR